MATRIPKRITWALEVLAVQPAEQILEVGCGKGQAVALICQQLTTGQVTGIDRSETAIRAAMLHNRDCIQANKARFLTTSLSDLRPGPLFDKIFAINVNVFWQKPQKELAILQRLMHSASRLYLFYEPPAWEHVDRIAATCSKNLLAGEFSILDVLRETYSPGGVCVIAQPASVQP